MVKPHWCMLPDQNIAFLCYLAGYTTDLMHETCALDFVVITYIGFLNVGLFIWAYFEKMLLLFTLEWHNTQTLWSIFTLKHFTTPQ